LSLLEILISLLLFSFIILSALGLVINLSKFGSKYNKYLKHQNDIIHIFHLLQSQILNKNGKIYLKKNYDNISLIFQTNHCNFFDNPCNITITFLPNETVYMENNLTFIFPYPIKVKEDNLLLEFKVENLTFLVRKKF